MAMPQTGQGRIGGRGREFNFMAGAMWAMVHTFTRYLRKTIDPDQCDVRLRWRAAAAVAAQVPHNLI